HDKAAGPMMNGVPMSWMKKWPGPYPVYVASAKGAHFTDVDGNDYVDFCLGDTGAMVGHSPDASVAAIKKQLDKGITFMLPTDDAAVAAQTLADRFGLEKWQFTLTATDANRHIIRYARHVTGRKKIVIHDYCYHGTVDETFANLDEQGNTISRANNIGAPVDLSETTWVVPFNDLAAAEKAFASGEIAAALIEPAMTNIGIVLPEPGYLEGLRQLATKYDVILIHDETHTLSEGVGGMTRRRNLRPDAVILGKTIGAGIPAGAFGMSTALAERIAKSVHLEHIDVGGVGGTLAGNALSMAAIRATLTEVLTEEAFEKMEKISIEWTRAVQEVIDEFNVPWQVSQLGCRAEYSFRSTAPRTGKEAADADDFALQQYLQLHAINRGVLMTPFHNMALISPETTLEDVKRHALHFREAVEALFG
ncbi:MAG: aminotransferase class III-fold pyridoxal phosphate-dependent enzyme, partial [Actinobacteria bacterium]|nr:aminotransferase class III-fold pyridoxal phosphate-dependent enzyme [Actinomycetota bacterium]